MSNHSLEAERQAILERMKLRREHYRRILTGNEELQHLPPGHGIQVEHSFAHSLTPVNSAPTLGRPVPTSFPRSRLMRTLIDHPFYCALGVAAVVAIGPRRVARTLASGSAALTTLAARNQSNIDILGRFLSMAGAYVQGRGGSQRGER
jgi:hypothetical protein